MTPTEVTREYVYKATVVTVYIDFKAGKVSLLNGNNNYDESKSVAKKWVFANREIEYMEGWHDILDAMKFAITEAKKELAAHQKMIKERNEF